MSPRTHLVAAAALTLGLASPAWAAKCPNMYIVLDRSGSMTSSVGTTTRWESAKAAIKQFTTAVINGVPRQQIMRFGLMVFPDPTYDECSKGKHVVACDFFAATTINNSLGNISPDGATPIGDTIKAARARSELADKTRKSYLILITDGEPNCQNEDWVDEGLALNYAVNEVASLANAGVKTFVIGFGSGVDPAGLNRLAEAGKTARSGTKKYYEANDTASLNAAFDAIASVTQGELGGSTCDDSCYSADNACPQGQKCVAELKSYSGGYKLNLGKCVSDPCHGKTCEGNQFCRDGACFNSCENGCDVFQVCKDGVCVEDPCPQGCLCDPSCDTRQQCMSGNKCVDPPCAYIKCPGDFQCLYDSCFNPNPVGPDFGKDAGVGGGGDGGTSGEGGEGEEGGCQCGAAAGGPATLGLFAGVFALLRRRRK